jgi:hypothetical protein
MGYPAGCGDGVSLVDAGGGGRGAKPPPPAPGVSPARRAGPKNKKNWIKDSSRQIPK